MTIEETKDILCNLCGLTCVLKCGYTDPKLKEMWNFASGLIKAEVIGGYNSTVGNGWGALDDGTRYKFSLCEFCLDWLFSQFTISIKIADYDIDCKDITKEYRPAIQRLKEDDWRSMKDDFPKEAERRNQARLKKIKNDPLT